MIRAALAVGLGAALAVTGFAAGSPASASDPTPSPTAGADRAQRTVAGLKTAVVRRIDLRLAALTRMDSRIGRCRHLTAAHEATLGGFVDAATSGLTQLRTKVLAETTLESLRADARTMVHGYRVFMLRAPQVHGACTADNEAAAAARLREVAGTLAGGIAKAEEAGRDTSAAEADLAAMNQKLDAAEAALAGRVDTLLAIQPGPDGEAIRSQVAAVRERLRTAWRALKDAVAEAKQVRDFLRAT